MTETAKQPGPRANGGKRQRRHPREVRSALTQSARHVFEQRGFSGATTREIAQHAGVNEVLLFRHFTNKANLFAETIYAPFTAMLEELFAAEIAHAPSGDPLQDRERFIGRLITALRENRELVMAVVNAQAYDPHLGAIPTLDSFFAQSLQQVMQSEIGQGADPAMMAKLMRCGFAAVVGTVLLEEWLLPGTFEDESERLAVLTRFVDFGMYGSRDKASFKGEPGHDT